LASQGVYGGGKRPFGYDVVNKRLVPNANEQAALARMQALRAEQKTYREIATAIAAEFGVEMPAMTFKWILDRRGPQSPAAARADEETNPRPRLSQRGVSTNYIIAKRARTEPSATMKAPAIFLRARDRQPNQRQCRRTSDEGNEFPPSHGLRPG
jgi:hypothetical protein